MIAGLAVLAPLLIAATAQPETRVYNLVLANNASLDADLAPLRYADDDGARYHELLSLMSTRSEILTVLDAESQPLFPKVAGQALAPTRKNLEHTLTSLFETIEADNQAGHRTVFYFVYIGHGSVGDNGEGVMHLLDTRFSRSDLFRQVVARSPARTNHVIIDACNAFLFVAGRGSDADDAVDAAVDQYLAQETMQRHPNTGFLLSTSSARDVHEWNGFRAGIFSHEVRSALAGGADVNQDGVITYDEVRAFLNAANAQVKDPRAKLRPWTSPPVMHHAAPLFDRGRIDTPILVKVSSKMTGRYYLEDHRGVRFMDFHIAPDGPVTLTLVPSEQYFLRNDREEIRIPVNVSRKVNAAQLRRTPIDLAKRGAAARTFREDLFAVPFGQAYYQGFRNAATLGAPTRLRFDAESPQDPRIRTWASAGIAAAGVAALTTGVVFGVSSANAAEDYRNGIGLAQDVDELRSRSRSRALTANILYGTGVAALTTAAILYFWPD